MRLICNGQLMGEDANNLTTRQRIRLLVRAVVPLVVVVVALLAGPTLLVWVLLGGPFGWRHVLIGGGISLALLIGMGAALGWAIGKLGDRHRR